ncbi:MAG: NUDIX hydrolase [Microthrixaceae bacterium]
MPQERAEDVQLRKRTKAQAARHDRANVKPRGYDLGKFPPYAVTVDIVIFTVSSGVLEVLLVERSDDPYAAWWALPGGFKREGESLDDAARRELGEETAVNRPGHLEQLGAYGDPGRDARGNIVTVAYVAATPEVGEIEAGGDAAGAGLAPVRDVLDRKRDLAFDHSRIVADAYERMARDLETTDLATRFTGPHFTLTELRSVFEAVWFTTLDPTNFRRTLRDGKVQWVEETAERAASTPRGGRPPEIYVPTGAWSHGPPLRRPRPS